MEFFRRIDRRTLLLWSLLLILSLLCSQGVALHVHNLDHIHDEYLDHSHSPFETSDHFHVSKIHSAYDLSHSEHHDSSVYEIDATPDGVLKNISDLFLTLALSVFPFSLLLVSSLGQGVQRCKEDRLIFYEHSHLSPPLRAPPF